MRDVKIGNPWPIQVNKLTTAYIAYDKDIPQIFDCVHPLLQTAITSVKASMREKKCRPSVDMSNSPEREKQGTK